VELVRPREVEGEDGEKEEGRWSDQGVLDVEVVGGLEVEMGVGVFDVEVVVGVVGRKGGRWQWEWSWRSRAE
jgi:hypothetical protein